MTTPVFVPFSGMKDRPPGHYYPIRESKMMEYQRQAARCWCDARTDHITMIPELTEVVAERLYLNAENAARLVEGKMPVEMRPCFRCDGAGKIPPAYARQLATTLPDVHSIDLLLECPECEGSGRQFTVIEPGIVGTRPVDDADIFPPDDPGPENAHDSPVFAPAGDLGEEPLPGPSDDETAPADPTTTETAPGGAGTSVPPTAPVGAGFTETVLTTGLDADGNPGKPNAAEPDPAGAAPDGRKLFMGGN